MHRTLTLLLGLVTTLVCAAQSEQSNMLFAKGVDLYTSEKYQEAIPVFEEVERLDEAELDSTSNRRGYATMWLASCYYRLGNTDKAVAIDPRFCDIPPLDRRLTIEADLLSDRLNTLDSPQHFEEALALSRQIMALEIAALGGETSASMGSRMGITTLLALLGRKAEAVASLDSLIAICSATYGPRVRMMEEILQQRINLYGYWNDPDGADRSFEALHNYYTGAGRSLTDEAYRNLDNWAGMYLQTGNSARYDHVQRLRQETVANRYGAESQEMAFLMLATSRDHLSMGRLPEGLAAAKEAERIGNALGGKSHPARLLGLVMQSNVALAQQDTKEARHLLRDCLKNIRSGKAAELKELTTMVMGTLMMVQSMEGKTDPELMGEAQAMLRTMRQERSEHDVVYIQTALQLALPMAMNGQAEEAASLIRPLQDFMAEGDQYSQLYNSGFVFLEASHYVDARKAFSRGLEILNRELSRQHAAQTVAECRQRIDISLDYLERVHGSHSYGLTSTDTTAYAVSMIKQDLLQSKLLVLAHSDSLGTRSFMQTLHDYAITAGKQTEDLVMADSIVGMFTARIKEHFGESSDQYQEALAIADEVHPKPAGEERTDSTTDDGQAEKQQTQRPLEALAQAWRELPLADYEWQEQQMMDRLKGHPLLVRAGVLLYVMNDPNWYRIDSGQRKADATRAWHELQQVLSEIKGQNNPTLELTYRQYTMLMAVSVWANYWNYDIKDRSELLPLFEQVYQWIRNMAELQACKESYEALAMYCDALDHRRWQDKLEGEALKENCQQIVETDRLRKQVRRNCIKTMEERQSTYSNRWPEIRLWRDIFDDYRSVDNEYHGITDNHLDYIIWDAYHQLGLDPNGSGDEAYQNLMATWNEVKVKQRESYISDDEIQKYIDRLNADAWEMLKSSNDSIARLAYDIALFTKGYLLRSEQLLGKTIEQSGNRTVLKKFRTYMDIQQRLDNTALPAEEARELESEAHGLWLDLKGSSRAFDDYTRQLEASWLDVRNALDSSEVAIEYIAPSGDYGDYYALVLRHDYEAPLVVSTTSDWQLQHVGDSIYLDRYNRVWPTYVTKGGNTVHPLEDVKTIYVSPSGKLHQVAIEYLPELFSDTLMCRKYNIFRLSNTREIIDHKPSRHTLTKNDRAALYGGIQYELDDDTWALLAATKKKEGDEMALRDAPRMSRGALSTTIPPLEGTRQEISDIADIFSTAGLTATTYTSAEATEDELKSMSGGKATILHIATHGFYQPKGTASSDDAITFSRKDDSSEQDALSRSGLFMAGAAATFNDSAIPANLDDGILTAREISHLDMTSLNLVVLSACETGLGDIKGDGVFGLQRGFKKAGAQSILMSLWKVDDQATRLLMGAFYRNLIEKHMTKREALIEAQHYLCHYDQGQYNQPRFWAAFILLDALD